MAQLKGAIKKLQRTGSHMLYEPMEKLSRQLSSSSTEASGDRKGAEKAASEPRRPAALAISEPGNVKHAVHVSSSLQWTGDMMRLLDLHEPPIGEGAFGKVYVASLGAKKIAVKVITFQSVDKEDGEEHGSAREAQLRKEQQEEERASLEREIELLRSVQCDYVVQYLGCTWRSSTELWILMEYCELGAVEGILSVEASEGGGDANANASLASLSVTDLGALEKQIATIMYFTLKGLAHLHSLSPPIAHFDIKANNLLLCADGSIKLGDFGVAQQLSDGQVQEPAAGTRHWMAPELFTVGQRGAGPASDIWAVGITAIELAEGEPPYAKAPGISVVRMVRDGPPPRLGMRVEDELLSEPAVVPTAKKLAKAVSRKALRRGTLLLKKPEVHSRKRGRSRKAAGAQWSEEFVDFVNLCLQKEPSARPSADELLQHPFVAQITNSKSFQQKGGAAYVHRVLKKWHAEQQGLREKDEKKAEEDEEEDDGAERLERASKRASETAAKKKSSSKKREHSKRKRASRHASAPAKKADRVTVIMSEDTYESCTSTSTEEEDEEVGLLAPVMTFPGTPPVASTATHICEDEDSDDSDMEGGCQAAEPRGSRPGHDYHPAHAEPVRHVAPAAEPLSEATPLVHGAN
eukprot:CAMPEP_0114621258 /NCGR_PEP_ID=MMETSP0168-20121206/9139_1 /TAXON_ID=95228 ORGANISM="Vannella sp., Strain DIVA3 517/6/12" /NCGR_SAMPLE_ID=MMETSP0168 /ASSEMBLY_ACC=CAM_ASM_000044 /LENGTH=635 /DNA_ID=CAMNT_0001832457 /DNA_START=17 /DNA_END=1921 /DNA_ORIENTATION=-